MKEICKQYAAYNLWANQKLIDFILQLTTEEQQQLMTSSFKSIHDTLLHIWDAEAIWWQRIKLLEPVVRPSSKGNRDINDVCKGILQQSRKWVEWTQEASKPALEHEVVYRDSKREQFKQPVFQVLLQMVNHGTYHRGQLVSQFRHLKKEEIPSTDFILWTRVRKASS